MNSLCDCVTVDEWLTSLGIDPDCDAYSACVEANGNRVWVVEVRIPSGDNVDEYLYGLEAAWADQFGGEPVEFKAFRPEPQRRLWLGELDLSTATLTTAEIAAASKTIHARMAAAFGINAAKVTRHEHTETLTWPTLPKHLLHAKGPRNRWGAAKGARTT